MNRLHRKDILTVACCAALMCTPLAHAVTLDWVRQPGTAGSEVGFGVSADGQGSVYISGATYGSLGGTNAGNADAFVNKYDAVGNLLWARQLGTSDYEFGHGISADALGNVYISGNTSGSLGGTNAGGDDAFVAKYSSTGSLQWTRQLGSSAQDSSLGVSADGLGNVYISGHTFGSLDGTNAGGDDAFVAKYDAAGHLLWRRQLGTSSDDNSYGVSADGLGNVYLTGSTEGDLGGLNSGGNDTFVAKYDASGNLIWTRQFGPGGGSGVSADKLGNVFVTGGTSGDLDGPNAGFADAFLAKYDVSGNHLWTRQLGTPRQDGSSGVSADGLGNVYLTGSTEGGLDGLNSGGNDTFVAKYGSSGQLLWVQQFGTTSTDYGYAVSAGSLGDVYIAGGTRGSLGATFAGGSYDAFVGKFSDTSVPEPTTLILTALAFIPAAVHRRFRRAWKASMYFDRSACRVTYQN